ncbi:MAG: 3-deoxy-D-manno-octulosonic acid transferase [Bacteroidales bacterium]|nr:3-deoxy-D-manno-octulosonic acid transferase [Bacteroidales bacterium]
MKFLYQISLWLYYAGIVIVSPFNHKAALWLKGRKNWYPRLKSALEKNQKPVVWVHCSSLGEFEQGRPVIEAIRRHSGDNVFILLSFYSPSGYEIRKNYPLADCVTYLPLDTPRNAKRWIDTVKPVAALFVKYEFWFHFLQAAHKNKTRLFLISAIFRPGQLFFRWYGTWYRNILLRFSHIFTQDENSARLLSDIGIAQVSVSGDTRFDRVIQIASEEKTLPEAGWFADGHLVVVAGSTWEPDEALLTRYIAETGFPLKMIIVPHEIHTSHLTKLCKSITVPYILFSGSKENENALRKAQVLVVDKIGLLSTLYRYGAIAYIGGGFGKGIHNILEAAVYGRPVLFGPNYHKALEAKEMKELGCGIPVHSYDELKENMDQLIRNTSLREKLAEASASYVRKNTGATRTILQHIAECLPSVTTITQR